MKNKPKPNLTNTFSIRISEASEDKIRQIIEDTPYSTRNQFIRDAIENHIRLYDKESKKK